MKTFSCINRAVRVIIVCCLTMAINPLMAQISWGPASNVAGSSFGNNHPRIVTNAAGNPLVIFGNANNVMISRWNVSAFTTPAPLNPGSMTVASASWMGPEVAAHGDTLYVVFKQTPEASDSSHIWCVHSYDGGTTFSAPVQVDNIADSISRFPAVTTDADGHPIVAFMKFDPNFGNARWVVAKSSDHGITFGNDVKASGWSSLTALVCDCCPGTITCSGNDTTVMLYRNNDNDIRDSWAGVSTDGGATFVGGIAIDQNQWYITQCPSSGPDGVLIGDTLYSVFMNGASGTSRVYFNKTAISTMTSPPAAFFTNTIPGVIQQNYPRIAKTGNSIAVVWKQVGSGNSQLLIKFNEAIPSAIPFVFDTVAISNVNNGDIALAPGNIFVVWQDDNSGTVKYRSGTYVSTTSVQDVSASALFSVFPNPANDAWILQGQAEDEVVKVALYDMHGKLIYSENTNGAAGMKYELSNRNYRSGIYEIRIISGRHKQSFKVVKN